MSEDNLKSDDADKGASPTLQDLKKQSAEAVGSVKDALGNMAAEARAKLDEILNLQKTARADQLSSFVRVVQTAATGLEEESPQTARLVRVAASSIDRIADDLRSKNVPDVVASMTTFARQQPAAVLAGSVLAGFVLARFLKSDDAVKRSITSRQPDYREWSTAHHEDTAV